MSKKRVHEVAKELKAFGIELDNKEVVQELVALGYDVKSHSSSLEDDQASAAIQAIVAKKKPKAPEPPVHAKGFVVRRKAAVPSTSMPEKELQPEAAAPVLPAPAAPTVHRPEEPARPAAAASARPAASPRTRPAPPR